MTGLTWRSSAPVVFVAGCSLMALVVSVAAQQSAPVRDAGRATSVVGRTGTASIGGVVMSDETPSRPIRRVTVQVDEDGIAGGRTVVTDDAGRFAFEHLPAGRYFLSAVKPAYLGAVYGARRAMRPGSVRTGTAIPLSEGQQMTDLTVRLTRGAVITGIVRDAAGQPTRAVRVAAFYYVYQAQSGQRVLQTAPSFDGTTQTDGRGVYRIFGLPPGEYLVAAFPGIGASTNLEVNADAELARAIETSRAGAPAAAAVTSERARRRAVGFAPVLYPGTTSAANATVVSLAAGEERSGVDLQMQLVPNARIEGTVVGPTGQPAAGLVVRAAAIWSPASQLASAGGATTDAEGRFSIAGLAPDAYAVAVTSGGPSRTGGPAPTPRLWALGSATLHGDDQRVGLSLQPGVVVSGRIVTDGGTPPDDPSRVRVNLLADDSSLLMIGAPPAVVTPDGRFTIDGVVPGRYRLSVTFPSGRGPRGWTYKSATIGAQDAADRPIEIPSGAPTSNILVTLTDRPTEFSGAIVDAAGRPAPEYFVIAFSTDRAHWGWLSRRIQQVRPARDGKFAFTGLPPGEYFVSAVTDVDQNEWLDPEFLTSIISASFKTTLGEGEKKVQNIQVK